MVPENHIPTEGTKICFVCQRERPANEDWYDQDAEKPDGLKATCKACRKEQRTRAKGRRFEKACQRYELSVRKAVAGMANGGANLPHSAEILEGIVGLLGGVNGMAKLFVTDYFAAPPGSPTRQKLMANLLKLAGDVTDSGAAALPDHLKSTEDLERELQAMTLRVIDGESKRVG